MTLLATKNLNVRIGDIEVCEALTLTFKPQEIWGILGRNGSGKTTLLHTLANLREPAAGHIALDGNSINSLTRRKIARQLGILFQRQEELFPATVLESALTGRHPFLRAWQWETEEDTAIANQALRDTDLLNLANRPIDTLSGGEMQRLKIATLLSQQSRVMLLDEPTNHLDLNHQVKLLELMVKRSTQQNGVIIMALHDINLAARFCTHVLVLTPEGAPRAGKVSDVLDSELLEQAYGWPLTEVAMPSGTYFLPA